jgi:hypothetical protein
MRIETYGSRTVPEFRSSADAAQFLEDMGCPAEIAMRGAVSRFEQRRLAREDARRKKQLAELTNRMDAERANQASEDDQRRKRLAVFSRRIAAEKHS